MTKDENARFRAMEDRLEGIEASSAVLTSLLDNHIHTQIAAFGQLQDTVEERVASIRTLISAKDEVNATKYRVMSWTVGMLMGGVVAFAVYAAIWMLQ